MNYKVKRILEERDPEMMDIVLASFVEGDIVSVKYREFRKDSITGKLRTISDGVITIDCSKDYESKIKIINFEDIIKIEKIN